MILSGLVEIISANGGLFWSYGLQNLRWSSLRLRSAVAISACAGSAIARPSRSTDRSSPTSRDSLAIVKSTIDLAKNMELESVAEGVETEEAAACLDALRVDALQGYLIARHLPADQVSEWLGRRSLGKS